MSSPSEPKDWKDELRQATKNSKAKKFKKLSSSWSAFGMVEDKNESIEKPFICGIGGCQERFQHKRYLARHKQSAHPFTLPKKVGKKKRDKQKQHKDLKRISKKKRQRIPKSRWPELIETYDLAYDKLEWASRNGIQTKNPYRLVNDWKKILSKENAENSN